MKARAGLDTSPKGKIKMRNKYYVIFYYSVTFLFLLFMREYWLLSRAGIHIDESQSFILASYNSKSLLHDIVIMTGDQFRGAMWFNDPTFSGMLNDVVKLWHDNRDTPHSNLYYSILRIWFTGINTSDFRFTLGWALQLNVLFFCISFTTFSALLHRLFKSHVVTISGLLIAFIGSGTISNTIFARPYQLQETMFIAFLFMSFLFIERQRRSASFLIAYGVVTAFTLLTGYFSIPFVLLVLFFTLIYCLAKKELTYKDLAKACSLVIFVSLAVGYLIYPKYLFVFGYRQTEALSKTSDFRNNFKSSLLAFKFLSQNYLFPVLILLASVALVSFKLLKRKCIDKNWFILFILFTVTIWSLAILYFAPYKTIRYIYPALPVYALAYCVIIHEAIQINTKLPLPLAIIIAASSVYVFKKDGAIEYQYAEMNKICEYSDGGNALFVLDKAFRMQVFTACLSNAEHIMTKKPSNVEKLLNDNNHIKYIISDRKLSGYDIIDKYSYYTIYKR